MMERKSPYLIEVPIGCMRYKIYSQLITLADCGELLQESLGHKG